ASRRPTPPPRCSSSACSPRTCRRSGAGPPWSGCARESTYKRRRNWPPERRKKSTILKRLRLSGKTSPAGCASGRAGLRLRESRLRARHHLIAAGRPPDFPLSRPSCSVKTTSGGGVVESLAEYLVLFVLVAIMGAGLPGPGDASLIAAGTLAGEGKLNIWIVLATAMAAWMLGSVVGYGIGMHGGRRLLDHPGWLEKSRLKLLAKGDRAFGRYTFVASVTMPAFV